MICWRFSLIWKRYAIQHGSMAYYEAPEDSSHVFWEKNPQLPSSPFLGTSLVTFVNQVKFLDTWPTVNMATTHQTAHDKGYQSIWYFTCTLTCPRVLTIQTLLRLYRALLKIKLDYGFEAYASASPVLQLLNPVHNEALRICTGAFR